MSGPMSGAHVGAHVGPDVALLACCCAPVLLMARLGSWTHGALGLMADPWRTWTHGALGLMDSWRTWAHGGLMARLGSWSSMVVDALDRCAWCGLLRAADAGRLSCVFFLFCSEVLKAIPSGGWSHTPSAFTWGGLRTYVRGLGPEAAKSMVALAQRQV